MKYFFLLIITAWFGLSLGFSGCKKEPKPKPKPKPLGQDLVDPEFKRYWVFKEGSWWVYKRTDTTAEVYDTVKVHKFKQEISFEPELSYNEQEYIRVNLSHSTRYFHEKNSTNLQTIQNDSRYANTISSSGGIGAYYYFFYWPINDPRNEYIVDTLPLNLNSLGKIDNVVHFEFYGGDEIWMARDIGFVKYQLKANSGNHGFAENSTWDLINYNINK